MIPGGLVQMPDLGKAPAPHPGCVLGGRGDAAVAVVHGDGCVGVVRERGDPDPRDEGARRSVVLLDLVVKFEIAGVPADDVVAVGALDTATVSDGLQIILV